MLPASALKPYFWQEKTEMMRPLRVAMQMILDSFMTSRPYSHRRKK